MLCIHHITILFPFNLKLLNLACNGTGRGSRDLPTPFWDYSLCNYKTLQDGDVCNVDVTVYHRGFHGDLNESFFVGNVPETTRKLVEVTYECLMKAIDIVKPGEKYREIGNVIQKHAQANGFSVVRSYCGHGIHRLFHTAPNVPHYASK